MNRKELYIKVLYQQERIDNLQRTIEALRRRIEELEERPVVYPHVVPYSPNPYVDHGPNDWPPIVVTNWTTQAEAQHGG